MAFITNKERDKLVKDLSKDHAGATKALTVIALIVSIICSLFVILEFSTAALDVFGVKSNPNATTETSGLFKHLFFLMSGHNTTVAEHAYYITMWAISIVAVAFSIISFFLVFTLKTHKKVFNEFNTLMSAPVSGRRGSLATSKTHMIERTAKVKDIEANKTKKVSKGGNV